MKTKSKARASLKAILAEHSAENVAQLARHAYKYTDCGACLGALIEAGKSNPGRWVYASDLHNLRPDDFISALSISSIVEGADQTTETHTIDLFNGQAVQAYNTALQAVEDEAQAIWNETHGCPTCAKHFGNVALNGIEECEGDDGATPVWDECPDCKGHGSII